MAYEPRTSVTEGVSEWFSSRIGGILVPIAATLLAFLIGGLVVLITGSNPITAYKAIFAGTGLNWFFPWVTGEAREQAANDLQQTLILMAPLILTALAVAFAFRCGLFNIGGQGQYWVGFSAALFVGSHMEGLAPAARLPRPRGLDRRRRDLGRIAGLLKATVGAHEVITTIMLNWIAIFGGTYLYEIGGPLQGPQESIPRFRRVFESAELWPIWGSLPSLHAGIFIALFALVVYAVILNRTTLGFEVRAVGFNPEAARYSGISVAKNYFLAMAIAGRSPVSPDRSTSSASSPASTTATSARTSSRSPASRSPCLGRTKPSASSSQPALRRARGRHVDPPARSGSSSPRSRSTSRR